jgi:signal transduction histidine kinase
MADTDVDQLIEAVVAVSSETSLPVVLRRIIEVACSLTHARYGALGVIGPKGTLVDFLTVGADAATVAAIGDPPRGHGILGLLIAHPVPLRLPDLTRHPDSYGFPPNHPEMQSFLGVPIRVRGEVFGNLYLTEKHDRTEFTEADERRVLVLATSAGAAIENARRNALARELAVMEDRERIARDLHDSVIQRLFATGMGLQSLRRRTTEDVAVTRLTEAVDALDDTIREIRSVIFAVGPVERSGQGFELDVRRTVAQASAALGFEAQLVLDERIDEMPDGLAEQVLVVVREGLSNVARHASATRAEVIVRAGDEVKVLIRDDGRGPGSGTGASGHGLQNLEIRARALGGGLRFGAQVGGGSVLDWWVPAG